MAHKITYAVLTATAVISAIESQKQFLAGMFSPNAYPIIIAVVATLSIAINAWRDWQAAKGH